MIFHILFNYNQSSYIMDEKIQKVLEEKIQESISKKNEIALLAKSLGTENENVFIRGIIIGRLYNSFYYQSRRILNRSPTDQEFSEFVKLLKEHENKLSSSFS